MFNIQIAPEKIMSSVFEEYKKAKYWHIKKNKGQKGLEEMRKSFMLKTYESKQNMYSNVTKYTSPKDNNWFVMSVGRWISGGYAFGPMAFYYYETVSSFGIFDIVETSNWGCVPHRLTCIHFTDHFFLRYMQRGKGVPDKKMDLAMQIVKSISSSCVRTEENEDGNIRCDIYLPGGIGRGFLRRNCPYIEIRTFLPDELLNNKQKNAKRKLMKNVSSTQRKNMLMLLPERTCEGMDSFFERHSARVDAMIQSKAIDEKKSEELYLAVELSTYIVGSMMAMEWNDPYNNKYWDSIYEKCLPVIMKYIASGGLKDNLLAKVKMYKECFFLINIDGKHKWNKRSAIPFVGYSVKDYKTAEIWVEDNWNSLN